LNNIIAIIRIEEYKDLVLAAPRADLFRILGDEDRLRLLALCAIEELTVGELATLLGESQPQVSKKSPPLRDAGLLNTRRDGTRTLLRVQPKTDAVIDAAIAEGKALCARDGSLARVAHVVAQREEQSRRYFDEVSPAELAEVASGPRAEALGSLSIFAPLLPGRALAIDLSIAARPASRAAPRGSPRSACPTCGCARATSTTPISPRRSASAAAPIWCCSRACSTTRPAPRTPPARPPACSSAAAT
jgi:DNA-binding transcriptional ArsR family regulator